MNDVFNAKKNELLKIVIDQGLFGRAASFSYSIEFQKRGMPHMHMLLTLVVSGKRKNMMMSSSQDEDKLRTPEMIDRVVSGEIPMELPESASEEEKAERNRQRDLVRDFMTHSNCYRKFLQLCSQ